MKPIVLIIDDESFVRKVIEYDLVNQGCNLEFASNGKEALQKATS